MESRDILALTFFSNDLDEEVTIREWLAAMLTALWEEGEGFSGKRPLGNSGWEYDALPVLIKNGIVDGSVTGAVTTISQDGTVNENIESPEILRFDKKAYNRVMAEAITEMGVTPQRIVLPQWEPSYPLPTTPIPCTPSPQWYETWTSTGADLDEPFARPKSEIEEE